MFSFVFSMFCKNTICILYTYTMVLKHHFTIREYSKTTWTTLYVRRSTKGRVRSNKTKIFFNLQITSKKEPLEAGCREVILILISSPRSFWMAPNEEGETGNLIKRKANGCQTYGIRLESLLAGSLNLGLYRKLEMGNLKQQ